MPMFMRSSFRMSPSSTRAQRLARWRAWRWRWAAWRQATQDGVFTIFAGKRAQSSRLQVWEWRNPIFGMPRNWQARAAIQTRSEEHTSELQSLMRISYAVFCLKKKKTTITKQTRIHDGLGKEERTIL